ncbi:MAG TPA: TIGR01777 family oxidoreductase [Chitinophagaceae bacterium]|jgi:hypothetical protein|nr:TIGR01777 family oxidoreductase [Chitinophagaceae bacterium]
MKQGTIAITGGTGLIGRALTKALLREGYSIIILTRRPEQHTPEAGIRYAAWDPVRQHMDPEAFAAADALIHLAGAGVAEGRWTAARKKEIVDSRVLGGHTLVESLRSLPNKVRAVIASSATGWYGPDPVVPNPKPFSEDAPPFGDFLGQTCRQWEESIRPVEGMGRRLVILRTGIVLSREGGAYPELTKTLPFGIASILGGGAQRVPWIHIDDIVGIYLEALRNGNWQGVYNGVAPKPVSNRELITTAAETRGRFFVPAPVPAFALKLAVGEMSIEVLKSVTASADKVLGAGYRFRYPAIREAIAELER